MQAEGSYHRHRMPLCRKDCQNVYELSFHLAVACCQCMQPPVQGLLLVQHTPAGEPRLVAVAPMVINHHAPGSAPPQCSQQCCIRLIRIAQYHACLNKGVTLLSTPEYHSCPHLHSSCTMQGMDSLPNGWHPRQPRKPCLPLQ